MFLKSPRQTKSQNISWNAVQVSSHKKHLKLYQQVNDIVEAILQVSGELHERPEICEMMLIFCSLSHQMYNDRKYFFCSAREPTERTEKEMNIYL